MKSSTSQVGGRDETWETKHQRKRKVKTYLLHMMPSLSGKEQRTGSSLSELMGLQFPQRDLLEARDHALFVRVPLMTGPKKHSGKIVGINKCRTEYRTLSYCQAVKPSDLLGNLDSLQTGNTQGKLKPFTACQQGTRNYICLLQVIF